MPRLWSLLCACSLACGVVVVRPAQAQSTPPEGASPPSSADAAAPEDPPAQDVVIRGRTSPPPAAGGDYRLRVGQLRDVPRRSAEQLLTLAPGVLLTNHGGEGHASQIFLRGFDAGEGQDLEFRLEGMPLNEVSNPHGHGYADTHFIIPELVEQLRFVQGPFDPRQGDFAVAGSAYYQLGLAHRGVTTKAQLGNFGERRGVLLWRPREASARSFVGVEHRRGDGFGPNRAHSSARLMAQHELRLGDKTTLTALITGYSARFDGAGLVRLDDVRAGRMPCAEDERSQFFCSYDANQGGASERQSVSLRLDRRDANDSYSLQLFGALRHLRLRQNLTGFLGDTTASDGVQRGDGVEQGYDAVTVGSRGEYRTQRDWRELPQQLEVGYVLRYDDGSATQRRLRSEGGAPYRTDFDNRFRVTNLGAYAAVRLRPLSALSLTGGVRADAFGFAVVDRNQPSLDRQGERLPEQATDAFGVAIQPRLGLELSLRRGLSWLTSVGVGTRSSEAQALSQGEFAPFGRVVAAEAGLAAKLAEPSHSLDARMLGYYTRVERDLVFDEQAGRNVLAGRSNRFGAVASVRLTSRFGLDAQSSVTYAAAYLSPAEAGWFELTAGSRMPYIPRWVVRTDLSLRRPLQLGAQRFQWMAALGTSYVAPRPLPNNQFGPTIFSADVAASVRWRMLELGVQIMNLLDRRNPSSVYNYVSNFRGAEAAASLLPQQHFSVSAPRSVMFSLTAFFGEWQGPGRE